MPYIAKFRNEVVLATIDPKHRDQVLIRVPITHPLATQSPLKPLKNHLEPCNSLFASGYVPRAEVLLQRSYWHGVPVIVDGWSEEANADCFICALDLDAIASIHKHNAQEISNEYCRLQSLGWKQVEAGIYLRRCSLIELALEPMR